MRNSGSAWRESLIPVAFVTTDLGIGGAERLLVDLMSRLDRAAFEPVLVCLKKRQSLGEKISGQGIVVYDELSRSRFDVRVLNRLGEVFRREQVQIVCTVGTGGDRSFWGRLAARMSGVPVVISCPHSMGLPDRYEKSNRMLSGITDAFIAVAHRQKQYLMLHDGIPGSKIHVVYNGIDCDRFATIVRAPDCRSSAGIPSDAPLAGVVACLRPEKHLQAFVRAARAVRQRIPNAHFVVVGDGPERGRLEALAQQLQLDGRLHFTGMCPDVRSWLHTMDVLVLTSVCEAFPVSLLEAMAAAKPVIATRVGAIPEMVRHEHDGLLVPPRDHEAVATAMCELLEQPCRARQLGQQAQVSVRLRFDLDAMVSGYEQLFRRLLSQKRQRVLKSVFSRQRPSPLRGPMECTS